MLSHVLQCVQLSTSRGKLMGFYVEDRPLSFVVPAVSGVLGPAASVQLVSLGTQSGEGALCPDTIPEQGLPLLAERCLLLNSHRGWS